MKKRQYEQCVREIAHLEAAMLDNQSTAEAISHLYQSCIDAEARLMLTGGMSLVEQARKDALTRIQPQA